MVPATVRGFRGQFNVINIFVCLLFYFYSSAGLHRLLHSPSQSFIFVGHWTHISTIHVSLLLLMLPYHTQNSAHTINRLLLLTCLCRVSYIFLQVIGNSCTWELHQRYGMFLWKISYMLGNSIPLYKPNSSRTQRRSFLLKLQLVLIYSILQHWVSLFAWLYHWEPLLPMPFYLNHEQNNHCSALESSVSWEIKEIHRNNRLWR